MLEFLGRLFGSGKALEGVVSAATSGIDALVYTDEEEATEAAKARTEARGLVVDWMRATQGQNLARRLIALMVTALWLLLYVITMLLDVTAAWLDPQAAALVHQSAQAIGSRASEMNGAVMLVLAFYFAAPHMGDIAKAALNKFGGASNTTTG